MVKKSVAWKDPSVIDWPKAEKTVLMELGLDSTRVQPDWEVAERYRWDPKDGGNLLGLSPAQIDAASGIVATVAADGRKVTWALELCQEQGMSAVQTQAVIAAAVAEGQRLVKEASPVIRKATPPPPPKKAKSPPPPPSKKGASAAPFGDEVSNKAKAAASANLDSQGRDPAKGAHDRYKDLKGKAEKLKIKVKGEFEHGVHDHGHLDKLEQQIGKHALDRTERDQGAQGGPEDAQADDQGKDGRVRGHSAPKATHDAEALGHDIHDALDALHQLERRTKGGPFWAAYQFVMKEGEKAAKDPSPEALEFTKRRIEALRLLITGGEPEPEEPEVTKSIRLDLSTGRLLLPTAPRPQPRRVLPPIPVLARDLGDELGLIGVEEEGMVRLIGDFSKSDRPSIVPDDWGGAWVHPSDGVRILAEMRQPPRVTLET